MEKNETDLEMQEMIKEKCFLRFPTLPFIPKLPYDVIATDYDNFALVSGAKDRSFIQVLTKMTFNLWCYYIKVFMFICENIVYSCHFFETYLDL